MKDKLKPNYKGSQSFILRDGWVQKALIEMGRTPAPTNNVFSKKDGVIRLGIGSNMVTSLKYWMDNSKITEINEKKVTVPSKLGELISKYDMYLEDVMPWQIIHLNLISNKLGAPLFWFLFNQMGPNESFTKESYCDDYIRYCENNNIESPNPQYVLDDFSVLVRTYTSSYRPDPEDNMDSPLSRFGLIKTLGKGQYRKVPMPLEMLDPLVVLYQARLLAGKKDSIAFEDLAESKNGPCKAFNFDRNSLMSIILELSNRGKLSITKTAGLNTIYLPKTKGRKDPLQMLFEEKYGGEK